MKFIEENDVVISSGTQKSKSFSIQASPKAFSILSDKLYKNKILAIVRELTCNYLDAHKLNNNIHTPCEIKVPTRLDPRFIIRDFGPGLNQEAMENLYTVYFASTKTHSNEYIGALGLGSKSPFGYTDTFTVVSYFEGKAYGYVALRNNGEPSLKPLFVEDMTDDEKTGLEITIPVEPDDIPKWQSEIQYALRPFGAVPPVIKGAQLDIDYFPVDKTDWFSSKNGFGFEHQGIFAVYGNIVYPITGGKKQLSGINYKWLTNRYGIVYIHFPLGSLDITPSREELSFDNDTVKNIIERVNALEEKTITDDIARFEEIKNTRELVRALDKLNSAERNILRARTVQIQGKSYAEWNEVFNTDSLETKMNNANMVCYRVSSDAERRKITSSWGTAKRISARNLVSVDQKIVHLMIDDKPSRRAATFRGMHQLGMHPNEVFIMIDEQNDTHNLIKDEIIELFKQDKVVILRMSELEEPRKKDAEQTTTERTYEKKPKSSNVQLYTYDSKDKSYNSESLFLSANEVRELEGYAIHQNRDDIIAYPDYDTMNMSIIDLRVSASLVGVEKFYAIRPGAVKYAEQSGKLQSLAKKVIDSFIEMIDEVDPAGYMPDDLFNSRIVRHITSTKKLNHLMNYFINSDNADTNFNILARKLRNVSFCSSCALGSDLSLANKIYDKITASNRLMFKDNIVKFEKDYPVISRILKEYDIRECIDDIVKIMKALEGAK